MSLEIKPGMVVAVSNAGSNAPSPLHPYFVSVCGGDTFLAYPLFDMKTPDTAFQIARYRVKEILGENLMQYMNKIRNADYVGTVSLDPSTGAHAVVTTYCSDGSVEGVTLDDGRPWKTDWPQKVTDSLFEFYTKRRAENL